MHCIKVGAAQALQKSTLKGADIHQENDNAPS
jgi:hypothetical protein